MALNILTQYPLHRCRPFGVTLKSQKGALPVITSVKEGSPAARAGVELGDKLVSLNGIQVSKKDIRDGTLPTQIRNTLRRPQVLILIIIWVSFQICLSYVFLILIFSIVLFLKQKPKNMPALLVFGGSKIKQYTYVRATLI